MAIAWTRMNSRSSSKKTGIQDEAALKNTYSLVQAEAYKYVPVNAIPTSEIFSSQRV